jgi:hypothetical protein
LSVLIYLTRNVQGVAAVLFKVIFSSSINHEIQRRRPFYN